jgi:hypothetical protein
MPSNIRLFPVLSYLQSLLAAPADVRCIFFSQRDALRYGPAILKIWSRPTCRVNALDVDWPRETLVGFLRASLCGDATLQFLFRYFNAYSWYSAGIMTVLQLTSTSYLERLKVTEVSQP